VGERRLHIKRCPLPPVRKGTRGCDGARPAVTGLYIVCDGLIYPISEPMSQ